MGQAELLLHELLINSNSLDTEKKNSFIPAAAASTEITTGADAYGAYGEMEDEALQDTLISEVLITNNHATVDELGCVEIAIGAAGAEVVVIQLPIETPVLGDSIQVTLPIPILLLTGERLAARFFTDTNATTHEVKVKGLSGDFVSQLPSASGSKLTRQIISSLMDKQQRNRIVTVPAPSAAGQFTATTVAVTAAWANPANYTESIAETTAELHLTHIVILESATTTTQAELDIAVGALAAEEVKCSVIVKLGDANRMKIIPISPRRILAGSRVSLRARGSAATNIKVLLVGVRNISQ